MVADFIECEAPKCQGAAVFRCHDCAQALCGAHRAMAPIVDEPWRLAGDRLRPTGRCEECQGSFHSRSADERLRQEARDFARQEAEGPSRSGPSTREAALQEAILAWEKARAGALDRLASRPDRYERLLLALRHWLDNPDGYDPLASFRRDHMARPGEPLPTTRPTIRCREPDLLSKAFPEYWGSSGAVHFDSSSPPWESARIATWFADRAKKVGLCPTETRGGWRTPKGWYFQSAEWNEGRYSRPGFFAKVFIDRGGRLWPDGLHLGVQGIYTMANYLGLEDKSLVVAARPQPD